MIRTKPNYLSEIIDAIFHIYSLKKKKPVTVLKTQTFFNEVIIYACVVLLALYTFSLPFSSLLEIGKVPVTTKKLLNIGVSLLTTNN